MGGKGTRRPERFLVHTVNSSTYGRVIAPRNASAGVHIDIPLAWDGKHCYKDVMTNLAMDKIEKMDFDAKACIRFPCYMLYFCPMITTSKGSFVVGTDLQITVAEQRAYCHSLLGESNVSRGTSVTKNR